MGNLLQGQTAIITGGNAGIGKAIALQFAQEGAKIAILGTNSEAGHTTLEEIKKINPSTEAQFYQVDVSKTLYVEEVIKKILIDFGQIDILINNAGITADQLLIKMSEDEWDRVLAINLKSCYNTCRVVARLMLKAKKGRIINISSVVGLMGNPGQTNYAASKAGIIGFTKALAKELAGRNILVNCVAPGFIRTKMTETLPEAHKEALLKEIPLGRMGEPNEIAHVVGFLASPLASYITGQVITVDGGMIN